MAELEAVTTAEQLGHLYTECGERMVKFARHRLRDAGIPQTYLDSEDVVQTAFANALRAPERIREPRPYLYRVIRSEVCSAARRYQAERQLLAAQELDPLARQGQVTDHSETSTRRMLVQAEIKRLSPPQQAAVVLTKVQGYTQHEASKALEKAPGTVATHVSRGMATLAASAVLAGLVVMLAIFLNNSQATDVTGRNSDCYFTPSSCQISDHSHEPLAPAPPPETLSAGAIWACALIGGAVPIVCVMVYRRWGSALKTAVHNLPVVRGIMRKKKGRYRGHHR